ncbi:hypothetical protein MKX34_05910 [Paenibacillus sp. FSL R5-0636]|uniref:hypothetical protein n=1 Tax=unclassified Paenibacillus TaxID=185978 RepID=UPI0030CFEC0C
MIIRPSPNVIYFLKLQKEHNEYIIEHQAITSHNKKQRSSNNGRTAALLTSTIFKVYPGRLTQ